MTSPDYTKKMNELRERVSKYSQLPNKEPNRLINPQKFNVLFPYLYIAPPILIFIILFLIKPSFITNEHIDENNVTSRKMNYTCLIITTLIGGIIIDIALFVCLKKSKLI